MWKQVNWHWKHTKRWILSKYINRCLKLKYFNKLWISRYIVRWTISKDVSAARFDFFCSNIMQMGILLEERKARWATETYPTKNRNAIFLRSHKIEPWFWLLGLIFFCSNVKQMGILLEKKKARRATEAPFLQELFRPSLTRNWKCSN